MLHSSGTSLERRHTYDAPHDLDGYNLRNSSAYVQEIANRSEFRILTSMLWLRSGKFDYDVLNKFKDTGCEAYHKESTSGGSHPDLGFLSFHRDRLAASADALGWKHFPNLESSQIDLGTLRSHIALHLRSLPDIQDSQIERRKLRITVSRRGTISVDSTVLGTDSISSLPQLNFMPSSFDLSESETKPCQVYIDTVPTPASLFSTHKTTHRTHYDAARARAHISTVSPTQKEVLLYNKEGEVTEASLCTVYLCRADQWITPAAICGGVVGVTRRLALNAGLCKQGLIELSEVQDGETVWLSNAARGFFVGQICLNKSTSTCVPSMCSST